MSSHGWMGMAWLALFLCAELLPLADGAQESAAAHGGETIPELELVALRADPADAEAWLARALWEAHRGQLGAALGTLDEFLGASGAGDVERARRERERLASLLAARDGRLAAAAASGARIPIQRGAERALVKVLGFADGQVQLGNNRFGLDSLPADELSCAELLKQEESLPPDAPKWMRAYAQLLALDGDWGRALPSEGGDVAQIDSLKADAEGLGPRLRLGRAVVELEQLADLPVQSGAALGAEGAQAAVASIRSLLAELSDLPYVASRRALLRGVALTAFGASFDADPGLPGLRGKALRLGDGRVRISYAFDDPAEIEDFALAPGALSDWHDSFQPVEKSIAESYLIARQGAIFGDGQVTYRHALDFAAPIRVRYSMRYLPREGDPVDVGVVLIGLAWDGRSSFLGASDFGDVYATEYELGRGERALCEGERAVKVGEVYEVEARLETGAEGAIIQAWRGGTARKQLPAGALRSGGLFLFVHSPRIVAFESLEIEGRPETFSLHALREKWVAAQLAALGL